METYNLLVKNILGLLELFLILYFVNKLANSYMAWFDKDDKLEPGKCECGHLRCHHTNGTGECNVRIGSTKSDPEPGTCACMIYIFDPDSDDDDDDNTTVEPDPSGGDVIKELERTKNGPDPI